MVTSRVARAWSATLAQYSVPPFEIDGVTAPDAQSRAFPDVHPAGNAGRIMTMSAYERRYPAGYG